MVNRDANSGYFLKNGVVPHKLTREDSIKGGKTKSRAKSYANYIKGRKKCSSRCNLYPCPFVSLSDSKFEGKCALKEFPKKVQDRVLKLYVNGEEGIVKELMETLVNISMKADLENDLKSIRSYFYDLMNLKKTIYGEKVKTELSGKVGIDLTEADVLDMMMRFKENDTNTEARNGEDKSVEK